MRFREVPERLLGSRTGVKVLRVLLTYRGVEMSGRQIASLAGAPHPRVVERLLVLEEEGLVSRRFVGRAHMWRLEQSHALAKPLGALFGVDRKVQEELRQAIDGTLRRIPGVVEARLFGSVARGDEEPTSDVDLVVVVKHRKGKQVARRELERLRMEVRERFGNWVQALVYTEAELRRPPRKAFLGPAREEGIVLVGKEPVARRTQGGSTRGA